MRRLSYLESEVYIRGLQRTILVQRLGVFPNQHETWCLISSFLLGPEALLVMSKLDPGLRKIDKKTAEPDGF